MSTAKLKAILMAAVPTLAVLAAFQMVPQLNFIGRLPVLTGARRSS